MSDAQEPARRGGFTGWIVRLMGCVLALFAGAAVQAASPAAGFQDPTATPAQQSGSAARSPLLAVSMAGRRVVAAGLRGQVVYSDDGGRTWSQASVPVQVDLTALTFPTPTHGWAVGHRGVVLESQDGGASWTRRFAGAQLNELAAAYYGARHPEPKTPIAHALDDVNRAIAAKSPPSLLDVWFDSPTSGTFVGTFNTIFRTEDGGVTWTPWMDRTDNPDDLHFYAVRGDAHGLYLAGEKGGVWRLDTTRQQWVAVPTGYAGTLFGLLAKGDAVLAFGMRGSILATSDAGRSWQVVPSPRKAGLAAGLSLTSGDIFLADQTGQLLRSRDGGHSFAPVQAATRLFAFSLAQAADGQVFSAGPDGVHAIDAR